MLFNTQTAAQAVQKQDVLFLEAGIHENIRLTNIRVDKANNGADFIEFTLTNTEGRSLKHTVYQPTKFENQTEEQFQNSINNRLNLMTDIFECYYEKGTQSKATESFLEYILWVKQILDNADLTKLLRIKAVYKNNGYVTLPEGSKYTFVEPMTANPVKVAKMRGDLFERPIQQDKEETGKVVDGTERFLAAAGRSEFANNQLNGTTGLPF